MASTDAEARNAQIKETQYKLPFGDGLYLLIHPNGSKYWRRKYRFDGKEKTDSFGVYPDVTLSQARASLDESRKLLRNGVDPMRFKKEQKRQAKLNAANSFEAIAREWHDQQKGRWSADHAARVLASLEKEVFPLIGKNPITDITAPIVLDVVRKVEKRDALDVASRVLQRASTVFRYAIQTGRAERNPCTDLVGTLKTRKVQHRTALKRSELPEFLDKLESYDGHQLTRLALRLVMLTFVRSRELSEAHWDEFDFERAEWRIPAERMKMRAPHIVPLSKQALAVLEEVRKLTGSYELVFPGQNDYRKPMSNNTMLYALYRMGYHGRATVHGFRATASTILNETGFNNDVIERQLAHAERNKVRAAYHRSEYLADRVKMMQWWGDFIDSQGKGAKVIPIKSNGRKKAVASAK